jgi:hypothetical protein
MAKFSDWLLEDSISKEDIADAKNVLCDWLYHFEIKSLPVDEAKIIFDQEIKKLSREEVKISDLRVHHDWGRRTDSKTPIIVAKTANDGPDCVTKYIILDGQHRFLTAKEKGQSSMEAIIINLPIKYILIGPKKKGYWRRAD